MLEVPEIDSTAKITSEIPSMGHSDIELLFFSISFNKNVIIFRKSFPFLKDFSKKSKIFGKDFSFYNFQKKQFLKISIKFCLNSLKSSLKITSACSKPAPRERLSKRPTPGA